MPATSLQNLSNTDLQRLLSIAKQGIDSRICQRPLLQIELSNESEVLRAKAASFVTLEQDGELKGCIGSLVATRPLALDVQARAQCSCSEDPRFAPVQLHQLESLTIEVSVLSPSQSLQVASESELLRYLDNNRVGVILSEGQRRSVFLPQVWEKLPDSKSFIQRLKMKGGWRADYWSNELKVLIFTVTKVKAPYNAIAMPEALQA